MHKYILGLFLLAPAAQALEECAPKPVQCVQGEVAVVSAVIRGCPVTSCAKVPCPDLKCATPPIGCTYSGASADANGCPASCGTFSCQ